MRYKNRSAIVRKLALTAALAAFYTVARTIPISRLVGISGSITAGGILAPAIGVLLETPYAIAAVFVGTFVASVFPWNPMKFYGLDFLPGALNVALVSLAFRGKSRQAAAIFVLVIATFLVNPNTEIFVGARVFSPPIPYLWLHLIALILLLLPLSKQLPAHLNSANRRSALLAITALAFTGTMIEHVTGGILFATVVGKGALAFWPTIFLIYPIERAIIVAGAVLICTPILFLLRTTIREQSALIIQSSVPVSRTDQPNATD
jgi:hypothetical protein